MSNQLPLRSTTSAGSDYSAALAAHWADQVADKYKKLWQKKVIEKASGLHFTQDFHWPARNYLGYEETWGYSPHGQLRPADKLLGNDNDDVTFVL